MTLAYTSRTLARKVLCGEPCGEFRIRVEQVLTMV